MWSDTSSPKSNPFCLQSSSPLFRRESSSTILPLQLFQALGSLIPSPFQFVTIEVRRAPSAIAVHLLQSPPLVDRVPQRSNVRIIRLASYLFDSCGHTLWQSDAPRPNVLKDDRILEDLAGRWCIPGTIIVWYPFQALQLGDDVREHGLCGSTGRVVPCGSTDANPLDDVL